MVHLLIMAVLSVPVRPEPLKSNELLALRAGTALAGLRSSLTSINSSERVPEPSILIAPEPLPSAPQPFDANTSTQKTCANGCTSANNCTIAQGPNCQTDAWGPIQCVNTASLSAGCTASGGNNNCAFTTTQFCANSTYYPSCYYTSINYPACVPTASGNPVPPCAPSSGPTSNTAQQTCTQSCNGPTSQTGQYTCSPQSMGPGGTCASGCVVLTDVQYACSTSSNFCNQYTLAPGCTGSGGPSYTINCLLTYKNAPGCTTAGACLGSGGNTSGQGINCQNLSVAPNYCGGTWTPPNQGSSDNWLPGTSGGYLGLVAMTLGLAALRRLGLA